MTRETPARTFRCPDSIWNAAQERAERDGEALSEVIRRLLANYSKGIDG